MNLSPETLLTRNLHEVFGQRDATLRRAAIDELFSDDCFFADEDGEHMGRAALDQAVTALQARFPGFVFIANGSPQSAGHAGRLAWGFGPPGEASRATGMDVALTRDGRIAALYTFLDRPPPAAGSP